MHLLSWAKIQSYDSKSFNWHTSQANMLYNYTEQTPQEEKIDITAEYLCYEMSRAQRLVGLHLMLATGKQRRISSYIQGLHVQECLKISGHEGIPGEKDIQESELWTLTGAMKSSFHLAAQS